MDTEPDAPSPAERPADRPAEPAGVTPEPGAVETVPELTATENMPAVEERVAERVEQPPTVRRPAPRKRVWLRVVAVVLGLLLGAVIAIALIAPGYLRDRIEAEARARGVVLVFADVEYSLSKIVLRDTSLALEGVPDFKAKAAWVEVDLVDWQPGAVRAGGLVISMSGTEVLGQLGAWKVRHADALAAPLSAEGARVDWSPEAGSEMGLSLRESKVAVAADKGAVDAADARALERAAGPVKVTWTTPADGFVVEIRPGAPPLSAVSAVVWSTKDGPFIKVTLARTALGPLQAALGIPRGSEGLVAEGEVEMPVPSLAKPAPIDASLKMTVKGYVPPHPKELDGILFGDATKVRAKVTIAPGFGSAKLSQLTVEAGALALTGTGDIAREGLDARVSLKLKGNIPCTALATSAAVAHLGSQWGRLAGGLAAGALSGSVGVALTVDARASDIKGAKIGTSASVRCKVALPGLPEIVFD